jgi:hypothetical protein
MKFIVYLCVAETKCNFGEFQKNTTTGLIKAPLTLFCSYGTLQTIAEFGLSQRNGGTQCPKDQYSTLAVMDTCSFDSMGQTYRQLLQQ